jgi:hypothetical protein
MPAVTVAAGIATALAALALHRTARPADRHVPDR